MAGKQRTKTQQVLDGLNKGLVADTLGAPVDLMTLAMNAPIHAANFVGKRYGLLDEPIRTIDKPFLGSEYIVDKMAQVGVTSKDADATLLEDAVRFASGVAGPGAVAKAPQAAAKAGRAVKSGARALGEKAADTAEGYLMRTGQALPVTAWHGSPSGPFKKFDPAKIGSGEGTAAYGRGHYVAEARPTAERYADALAKSKPPGLVDRTGRPFEAMGATPEAFASVHLAEAGGDYDKAKWLLSNMSEYAPATDARFYGDAINALGKLKEQGVGVGPRPQPHIYKIDLPDEHVARMLDWDKPLSQQPAAHSLVAPMMERGPLRESMNRYTFTPDEMKDASGKTVYELLGNPAAASQALREAGVPGLRYLDAASRNAGQGTSNFVVFPGNEDMLRILEVNGKPINGLLD